MIRDRGKIKWTSMMLPEHVQLIREWAASTGDEKPKILDEQHIEYLETILMEAIHLNKNLQITVQSKKGKRILQGWIRLDPNQPRLFLTTNGGKKEIVYWNDIMDITTLDAPDTNSSSSSFVSE